MTTHGLTLSLSLTLVVGIASLGCKASPPPPPPPESAPEEPTPAPEPASSPGDVLGNKAPGFELETTQGETVRLSDLEGKVVVLDFWAVWCGPCRESMPFFEKLQNEYEKDGLVVIGLHVDDRMPSIADVNSYLSEVGATYRNLVSSTDVDNAFDIVAMPTTYLIDRSGKVRKRHIGFNPARTPERLVKDVRALLELETE